MPHYFYKAITVGSAASAATVSGESEAMNEKTLRDQLHAKGLIPIQVRPVGLADTYKSWWKKQSISHSDRVWFFQTLYRLLKAKMPIDTVITTMEELAPKPRLAEACEQIRRKLRGGTSLAEAVTEVRGLAEPLQQALLKVAHESGRLEHVAELIDRSLTSRQELRRLIVGRMIYPAILTVVAFGALWFISWYVIPSFAETLASVGAELPMSTRITLVASQWGSWLLPVFFVVGVLGIRAVSQSQVLRDKFDRWSLHWPIIGPLRWFGYSILVTDTMATILESGGELRGALEQVEQTLNSAQIRQRLAAVRRQINEGSDPGKAIIENQLLPKVTGTIVQVGMRSGDLLGALRWATQLAVEEQRELSRRLLTLLEPATILSFTLLIGWIIYSLVSGMLAINDIGGL